MLYFLCGNMVLILLVMLVMNFNYIFLIIFEIYTIIFLYLVLCQRSSYERRGANVYLMVFGYVMRFGVVISNDLKLMRILLLLLGITKLPVFGLHIWLPKVHVEASMLRSMILAGGVLKLGILYIWNFRVIMIIGVVVLGSMIRLILSQDRKLYAAISSVLHITLCILVGLYVMLLIRYIHIVLSPLMFMTVYICYVLMRSRYYIKNGVLIIVLWIVNFRLPVLGGFFSEVYIIMNNGVMLMLLICIYIMVRYVIIKSINDVRSGLIYIPWIVLYIVVV